MDAADYSDEICVLDLLELTLLLPPRISKWIVIF
jgi:hypothetical protein